MPFVSIIIPIYNVEKYLRQCIDSVINQHLKDFELILEDDGSPDNSPAICDEYAEKHPQIKVIHKPNGGASTARNAGIRTAQGEYLMFMDSDDWWNPEISVSNILSEVKQNPSIEMFLFTSYDYVEGKGLFKRKEHENLKNIRTDTIHHYYQDLINNGNLEVSASTKIIKKQFIYDNNLFFREGIFSEDSEWMLRILRKLSKVKILDIPLYICKIDRQESVTHTIKAKNIKDQLTIVNNSLDYYKNDSTNRSLKELELCFASYLWFSALGLSSKLSKKDRKEVKQLFLDTKEVCSYSNSKKTKLCNTVLKIMGFNLTTSILGFYIKMNEKYKLNKKTVNS